MSSYNASDIEVLTGVERVRRRPGMYTHTQRPNHLAHEVIDNSVDEAIGGYCKQIDVTLYKDGSLEVADDGRGMPVDIHPKEKVSGVELILTRLHAGGKFSDKTYQFSGGLHGVGVSVVNALSKHLECWVKRDGKEYLITFKDGKVTSKLEVINSVGARNTGTTIRFWPDAKFFDSDKFSVPQLKHTLKAKAVLCPGLRVRFTNEATGEKDEWFYSGDLGAYLLEELGKTQYLPDEPISGKGEAASDTVDYALVWAPQAETVVAESYVNLIPTIEGGTHVNGLRAGVAQAVREFCEFRNLVPRGVKLAPEDVWQQACFVLSLKMHEPDVSELRYPKICILADADSDGQHIATLLCALFLRHFRPLVTNGHVYVAMPPLFRIDAGREVHYALDERERDTTLKKIAEQNSRTRPMVTRFKG